MIRNKWIEGAAWIASTVAVFAAIWIWSRPIPSVHTQIDLVPHGSSELGRIDIQSVRRAAVELRNRNPFRMERRPTSVRFGSAEVAQVAEVVEVHDHRPNLVLSGIIGGPPWIALIEGIPGREIGVALVQGEEVNGIRLERLQGDTAILSGLDTTWVLMPKQVWQ